jgi:hypothetical protein
MKQDLRLLIALSLLTSCRSAWHEDNKVAFRQACVEEATTWASSPARAATYCDCVIGKMNFAKEEDALIRVTTLVKDTTLMQCKTTALQ